MYFCVVAAFGFIPNHVFITALEKWSDNLFWLVLSATNLARELFRLNQQADEKISEAAGERPEYTKSSGEQNQQ